MISTNCGFLISYQAIMGEVLVLLFLSSAMLIGCYMAGMIPLIVSLSEVNINYFDINHICTQDLFLINFVYVLFVFSALYTY